MADNDITFNLTFDDVFGDKLPIPKSVAHAATPLIKKSYNKKDVVQFATIQDFKNAHNDGIKQDQEIPNNVSASFHITGTKFDEALNEINRDGAKSSHWIWYILPSDLSTKSTTAQFFKLGDKARNRTVTIEQYLNDEMLRNNYITIINAIYTNLKNKTQNDLKIMFKDTLKQNDYDKLKSSITNFITPLLNKIKSITPEPANIRNNIQELYKIVNNKEYKAPT